MPEAYSKEQLAALQLACAIRDLNERWEPHPAQRSVLSALFYAMALVVFLEAGRKFGKTEIIAYFLWRRAMTVPGGHYYFAPEQKQAREIFWATGRLQSFGPREYLAGKPNDTEMRMRFRNGSFIKVDGSDNFNAYRGIEPHSAVYDEFRDFRPEFHQAFGPNLGVYQAPLLICSTPPEALELPGYDGLKVDLTDGVDLFNFPGWQNPHMPREWLRKELAKHIKRGEQDVWDREFGAKRVRVGSNAIFPMFDAPTKDRQRTKHVRPHAEVMAEISRSRKRLVWQVIADPGTTSCFGVLFRAIDPYTRRVYRLAEIYETDQRQTSTSRIIPRIGAIRDELYPDWQDLGAEWEQIYDEEAAWFQAEIQASFPKEPGWSPTRKGTKDKRMGLSLMKDQMVTEVPGRPGEFLTVVSDRCENFIKETAGYIRDKKGEIPKKDDHLIDCDRYGNDFSSVDLHPVAEPEEQDPDDMPRYRTPEQDMDDDKTDDFDLEDF